MPRPFCCRNVCAGQVQRGKKGGGAGACTQTTLVMVRLLLLPGYRGLPASIQVHRLHLAILLCAEQSFPGAGLDLGDGPSG